MSSTRYIAQTMVPELAPAQLARLRAKASARSFSISASSALFPARGRCRDTAEGHLGNGDPSQLRGRYPHDHLRFLAFFTHSRSPATKPRTSSFVARLHTSAGAPTLLGSIRFLPTR